MTSFAAKQKVVQGIFQKYIESDNDVDLVFLLLTLNVFHTFF